MEYVEAPIVTAKLRLRKVLREMCALGIVASILIFLNAPNPGRGAELLAFFPLCIVMTGPPLWVVYKLLRFVIGR